jgi:hypothetical protein
MLLVTFYCNCSSAAVCCSCHDSVCGWGVGGGWGGGLGATTAQRKHAHPKGTGGHYTNTAASVITGVGCPCACFLSQGV